MRRIPSRWWLFSLLTSVGAGASAADLQGIRLIEEQGPFVIHADKQIAKPLDELLRAFVAQGRMKLVGEYRPSYRIA